METTLTTEDQSKNIEENTTSPEETEVVNIYPAVRHLFLTLCIILALLIILFLVYQNGKSIYDKGI